MFSIVENSLDHLSVDTLYDPVFQLSYILMKKKEKKIIFALIRFKIG